MNLRKSDKLIAVIGVVIIIIAAIAIIIYVPENGDGDGILLNGDVETKSYEIQVDEFTSTDESISGQFSNNGLFLFRGKSLNKNIKCDVRDNEIVGTINVTLDYTERQYSVGILPPILKVLKMPQGVDTVKVTITDPMGNPIPPVTVSSGVPKTVKIPINNNDIGYVQIDASSLEEAEMELDNITNEHQFNDINDEPFIINAELKIRGKVKLLARLFERFGQDTLQITYSYSILYYSIKIPEEPPNNDEDEDGGFDSPYTGNRIDTPTWSTFGYPGGKL